MDKIGWNYGVEGMTFSGILAIVGSLLNYFFGGWDSLLGALCIFMASDFVVGFLAAAKRGELDSNIMLWGGVNKLLVLVLVAVGTVLDGVLPIAQPYVRTAVIWFYIGREGISLVENYGKMGQKLPDFLANLLVSLQKHTDDDEPKE